jgi:hypothetical protein
MSITTPKHALSICSLPVEVIEAVATRLSKAALFSFRLVCKDLDKKTFYCFARKYFRSLQFQYYIADLLTIRHIFKHRAFGEHVRKINLSIDLEQLACNASCSFTTCYLRNREALNNSLLSLALQCFKNRTAVRIYEAHTTTQDRPFRGNANFWIKKIL